MIDTAITACKENKIPLLAIQQPGFKVPQPDSDLNITIVADLNHDDAVSIICEAATLLMPKMLVFGVSPDRGEGRFTTTQSEMKIIQELFWLHAGKAGFIKTAFHNLPSCERLQELATTR